MALYRFLFAPVLLAVAVLLGSQDHTPPARRAAGVVEPRVEAAQRPAAAARAAPRPVRPTTVR